MGKPDIKKSPYKIYIYYIIGALVLFGVINCIGLIHFLSVRSLFFLIILVYLLVGIIHLYLAKIFFAGIAPRNNLLFVFILTFLGFIGVFLLNYVILKNSSHTFYTLGLILFPLPFLFVYSLNLYLNIPARIFKKWHYPMDHTMPDLDLLDLSRVLIIQFEFLKSTGETSITNFKAKAPYNMPFGELFYIFITDYNDSHPQNTIEISNRQLQPFPWVFYIKTPWWRRNKYVDPDLTFQDNGIVNNDIIFCQRVDE